MPSSFLCVITLPFSFLCTPIVALQTGLFSAAVSVLLAVSVQDIRPNPQDSSAATFYLANIYQILANSNITVPPTSIPSTLTIPAPFSPPRYAIWVNSLWSLSLVISMTGAILATSLHQWSRRYIRLTQQSRYSPEVRARLRAFFNTGMNEMHLPWAVEALPALIHLSLFLFFAGLAIFLFNINHSVFIIVIWWIGVFTAGYVLMTVMPIFRHDSPYYAPLSSTAAFLPYALFSVLASGSFGSAVTYRRFKSSSYHYGQLMLGGSKAAEETASKKSSDIDLGILEWTIGALGNDETLERLFEAIPGFFSSPLVKNLKRPLPRAVRSKFVDSFRGFLSRTLTSNSVNKEVKIRRLDICMNGAMAICEPVDMEVIVSDLFDLPLDQVPLSNRTAEILTRWCTSNERHFSSDFQQTVAKIFLFVRERDDRWIALAKDQFGMPENVLRDNIAHGDNSVLLAILIHKTRRAIRTASSGWQILKSLSKFDIRNTVPRLQNKFCALWNEVVLESRSRGWASKPVKVLRAIRHLYIALHEGTDAAPTAFDASTEDWTILCRPSSYPFCNIDTHHPSGQEIQPILGGSAAPQQTEESNITPGLPSSAHHAPPAQALDIAPQVTSDTAHSIHESLQTVTLDRNQLVSTEVPHLSPESLLSTTDPTPNIGHNDEPTPNIPVTQVGEISHIPTATSPGFPHPNPVPVVVTPSTAPHPPSVSVEQRGDFSDAPQPISSNLEPYSVSSSRSQHAAGFNRATCSIRHHSSLVPAYPNPLFYPWHRCHSTNK